MRSRPTFLVLLLVLLAPAAAGQSYRLNDPLALGGVEGAITEFRFSPDSAWVVYLAGFPANPTDLDRYELYSVPLDLSHSPVRLNGLLDPRGNVAAFTISPDGSRVVYYADQEDDQKFELYSVPIDGSQSPTRLHPALGQDQDVGGFRISPDSSRVVYRADQETDQVFELYSVSLDGSQPPVKLNPALPEDGDVVDFKITGDNSRVVYLAEQDTDNVVELYSVPLAGGALPTKLNGSLPSAADVDDFALSPDSSRVVYLADQDSFSVNELYSVPLTGGQPVKLNDIPTNGGDVFPFAFAVSPDSSRVVFRGDLDTNEATELYSVPLDGSQPAVKLNAPLPLGGDVAPFQIAADSSRVVYLADQDVDLHLELYSVPLHGSAAPVKLNEPLLAPSSIGPFDLAPDGSRVIYFSLQDPAPGGRELYSVPTDGSLPPVKLNDPLVVSANVELVGRAISPDSTRVLYVADQEVYQEHELYSVPLDRSEPPVKLSAPLSFPEHVSSTGYSPDGGQVVFRQGMASVFDIFRVPPTGGTTPVRLNDRLRPPGSTFDYGVLSSREVVYLAQQDTDGQTELYRTQLDGSTGSAKLSAPLVTHGDVQSFDVTPDEDRVVYRADQDAQGVFEFFGVPLDGSQAPTKLNGDLVAGGDVQEGRISPDSQWFVYLADEETNDVLELFATPIDGSAARVKLNTTLPGSLPLFSGSFAISEDSSRVVYLADHDTLGVLELYSVPVDGSEAPVRLNATPVAGGNVRNFRVGPGRIVYLADQDTDGRDELYSVPLDGSAAPTKLNAPLPPGGRVGLFLIDPTGANVVFSGAQTSAGVLELWTVPLAGGRAPLRLSDPLVPDGDVFPGFQISADGTYVVYEATRAEGGMKALYGVRTDGSRAPETLAEAVGNDAGVFAFAIDPLADRVVFVDDRESFLEFELYGVPIDGGQAPVKLSGSLGPTGDVTVFEISPDGSRVVYLAHEYDGSDFVTELFSVPVDGSANPTRLNGDLIEGGDVLELRIAPDLSRVVYRADELLYDGFELFAAHFEPELGNLNPAAGRVNGGNRVLLTGTGFTRATEVLFGGAPAKSVTWLSATQLRVVTPPFPGDLPQPVPGPASSRLRRAQIPPQTVDVSVSEGSTSNTLADAFTYLFGR